jgi:hypothetical protein
MEMSMQDRYRDVPTALSYSMIHLTGDFPLVDYTLPSKFVLYVGIILGMCTLGTFAGIFSSGFVNYMVSEKEDTINQIAAERMQNYTRVALRLQYMYRVRKRKRREAEAASKAAKEEEEDGGRAATVAVAAGAPRADERGKASATGESGPDHQSQGDGFQKVLTYLSRLHHSERFKSLCAVAVIVSLFNVITMTVITAEKHGRVQTFEKEFQHLKNAKAPVELWEATMVTVLTFLSEWGIPLLVEGVCDIIFAVQYVAFLSTVRRTPMMMFSFWHLLDLLAILPGVFFLFNLREGTQEIIEVVLLVRVVKILEFPRFRRERLIVTRALASTKGDLVEPLFLAIHVWVTVSCLFTWWEAYGNGPSQDYFPSIPHSMYWTAHFLIGEWVFADFSPMGSALIVFCCVFGMMIFAIPSGIIIEAVQSSLTQALVEDATAEQLSLFMDDTVEAEEEEELESPKQDKKKKMNLAVRCLKMQRALIGSESGRR